MSCIKRLAEDIYYDYILKGASNEEINQKFGLTDQQINSIKTMFEEES